MTAPWATLPRPVAEPLAEIVELRPQVEERDRPVDLARAAEIERETLAPIPLGVDINGNTVHLNVPGAGGRHVLMAGTSGAGKTTCVHCTLLGLHPREHVCLALFDPKEVDLIVHRRRAAMLCLGEGGARQGFSLLMAELSFRKATLSAYIRAMEESGQQLPPDFTLPIGVPILGVTFPWIVAVVDEAESLTDTGIDRDGANKRQGMIRRYLRLGRALGMGMLLATQRPAATVIPTPIRDLCYTRVAFRCGGGEASRMILGDGAGELDPPPHKIRQRGEGWMMVDEDPVHFQAFVATPDVIAREAARWPRVPGPASWPHVIEDDAEPDTCPHCGR